MVRIPRVSRKHVASKHGNPYVTRIPRRSLMTDPVPIISRCAHCGAPMKHKPGEQYKRYCSYAHGVLGQPDHASMSVGTVRGGETNGE